MWHREVKQLLPVFALNIFHRDTWLSFKNINTATQWHREVWYLLRVFALNIFRRDTVPPCLIFFLCVFVK